MDDKYLLICTDNLESFSSLFDTIKEYASFDVDCIPIIDLLEGKYLTKLKHFRAANVFIAIDEGLFSKKEQQIRDYCNSLEEVMPFTNFLYLYTDPSSFNDINLIKNNKHEYILFKHDELKAQAIQFTLYVLTLFNKAVLANRLADYIFHSFKEVVYYEMLKKQKSDIEELNEELAKKNKIDNLTNLYNRRALFDFLEKERGRTLRSIQKLGGSEYPIDKNLSKGPDSSDNDEIEEDFIEYFGIFSVMMIDLDHFKKINDTHGHLVGDKVLKTIGKLLQQKGILRDQDIAGRFGGEEFIVILPNTNAYNALGPAMRLVSNLDTIEFSGNDAGTFKVKLSIGISEYHPTDKDNEAIIYRADQAMYYAKEHGRNQIIIYEKVFD